MARAAYSSQSYSSTRASGNMKYWPPHFAVSHSHIRRILELSEHSLPSRYCIGPLLYQLLQSLICPHGILLVGRAQSIDCL